MREHPIIQCIKSDGQVHARFGDVAECPCGNIMLEVATGAICESIVQVTIMWLTFRMRRNESCLDIVSFVIKVLKWANLPPPIAKVAVFI